MPHLQVITVSTRPARKGPAIAEWFLERAREHGKFEVEPVDLARLELPLFDEPKHPRLGEYTREHTRVWSETVKRADAFVFVTAEYDFGPPASILNALQYLVNEWAYKPVGFVSYGGVSAGSRSVNTLRIAVTALKMMPMVEAVAIPFFATHFDEESGTFAPPEVQAEAATTMLDELLRWTEALRGLRSR